MAAHTPQSGSLSVIPNPKSRGKLLVPNRCDTKTTVANIATHNPASPSKSESPLVLLPVMLWPMAAPTPAKTMPASAPGMATSAARAGIRPPPGLGDSPRPFPTLVVQLLTGPPLGGSPSA